MPRQIRDSSLETRTARSRLKVQHKPYFRLIEPGLHLGFRKLTSGPGAWVVRRYKGDGVYSVENLRTAQGELVVADDFAEPDGAAVLSFAQAQNKPRASRQVKSDPAVGPYTVADAMEDYFTFLASDGRAAHSIYDGRRRDHSLHPPRRSAMFGSSALTTDELRRWRDELARAAPRLGLREGEDAETSRAG